MVAAVLVFTPALHAKAPAKPVARSPNKTAQPAATANEARRKAALQSEKRDLQQRLERMKRQLAAAEASQADATDALRASESAISIANRRLRELAAARAQAEGRIRDLQQRSRATLRNQSEQEQQRGLVLRAQFVTGRTSPWHRLFDGENPNQIGREQRYLEYVSVAQNRAIGELRSRLDELAALEDESRDRRKDLEAIAREESDSRAQLLRQQAVHKQALERASKQIRTQRESIAALERDERRLSGLIDQLSRVLAEQERQRQLRDRKAKQGPAPPRQVARPTGAPESAAPAMNAAAPMPPQMRMALPVQGEIVARFGGPRRTEAGVDAPTWKGLLIQAPQGAEVRVVAGGQVIFSDWLRGFGNLLIVDHGNGVMSVYGNNATLARSVGDRVAQGDVIAEVGNTGGMPQPGLYFEVRHRGRPVDPLQWIAAR
jgi:murein hydrolase activator